MNAIKNAIKPTINSTPDSMAHPAPRAKARSYRALAAECERQAELAFEEPRFREMQQRLAKSYAALADAEDWLDGVTSAQNDTSHKAGSARAA